jgi:hypothetical protein
MAAPEAVLRDAGPEIDRQEMPDEVTPMVEVAAADPSLGGLAVGLLVGLLTLLLIWWLVSRRRLGRGGKVIYRNYWQQPRTAGLPWPAATCAAGRPGEAVHPGLASYMWGWILVSSTLAFSVSTQR